MLFVSRLEPRKGFSVALRAFEILAERLPDVRFLVVGEGPERAVLEGLRPELRERVLAVGAVSNDQLPPYYAAADVFVAPAIGGESFGYILVEAMAAGLPVVASAIPGYDEVVRDGVEGLLVTPSDPRAFAGAIERILTDRDLAKRLGEAGRERALVFGWDRVAAEIEEIYQGLTDA
jgi:phosphatidylinositol alpha-mannosyltransferase